MRIVATIVSLGACAAAVLGVAGCGATAGTGTDQAPPEQTQEQTPEQAPVQDEEQDGAQQWVMPDLAGSVLQDAQDEIQALTGDSVFFTRSHDLSGEDRHQILDADWTVCTQSIPAGAAVTPASQIDFGVVKLDETCP